MTARLRVIPMTHSEASAFVALHHRHHGPSIGAKFWIGIADEVVRGVAVVGRPVARMLDDGWTLEVTRCCTDGVLNGCSMLYGAAWRAARALGYRRLITYTLDIESGTSMKASGWRVVGQVDGRSWNCESRPRVDTHPLQNKLRWEMGGDANG